MLFMSKWTKQLCSFEYDTFINVTSNKFEAREFRSLYNKSNIKIEGNCDFSSNNIV